MNIQLIQSLNSSNAQALQDVFADYINQYSNSGYFLDLGANLPVLCNNSINFERKGWSGLLVDYNQELVNICSNERSNKCICANLITTSLNDLMVENNSPEIIDYVSLDLDYCAALTCIKSFDFSKFKIKCMTFEHDAYADAMHIDMRSESREFLQKMGLKLVCKDVSIFGGKPFEDWYVNPELVEESIYSSLICENKEYNTIFSHLI
jgi:hypothetical protein